MGFSRTRSTAEQYKDCSQCGANIDVDDGFVDIDGYFHCQACLEDAEGEVDLEDVWLD